MITSDDLVRLCSYFTKVHHTPGRLRVKVDPRIKSEAEGLTTKDIESLSLQIKGIKKIKLNSLMGTVTLLYEPSIFSMQFWEDLIEQKNVDQHLKQINIYIKEFKNDQS